MLTLFKSKKKEKSMNEIIDEIHETFYTEVDRLLVEANISKPNISTNKELEEKGKRLQRLNFVNTKEARTLEENRYKQSLINSENRLKQELIKAITYFNFTYPNYKFITEESVRKICEKYGLVYGKVSQYIGSVPDVNLKHIEDFKVKEGDLAYIRIRSSWALGSTVEEYISYEQYIQQIRQEEYLNTTEKDFYGMINIKPRRGNSRYYNDYNYKKAEFEIAAPLKDFKLKKNQQVKDSKIMEILDPVVLQPVIYENKKYYLIVTAWGQEASDELVVNHKMN